MLSVQYEKYWLSRIVSVQAIVSADFVQGRNPGTYHHMHADAWEMLICMNKNAYVIKDNDTVTMSAGDILFVPPGITHALITEDDGAETFVVSFICSNDEYLRSLQDGFFRAKEPMYTLVKSMIRELADTFSPPSGSLRLLRFIPKSTSPVGAEQMICCYLEQFLILLLREATMEKGNVVSSGRFREAFQTYLTDQVTEYIRQHLGEPLTVQSIADHFHYSRARLSSLYKEATGISIGEFITDARIQEAKKMLHENVKSIAQISEELGFSSPQYFSFKFTKATGVPPSRYGREEKKA